MVQVVHMVSLTRQLVSRDTFQLLKNSTYGAPFHGLTLLSARS